jgi:hypothetical protein
MRTLIGVGSLFLTGAAAAIVIGWLSSRPSVSVRVAGMLLGAAVAVFCWFVLGALIADGGDPRLGGVLAMTAFAVSGVAAIHAMIRGLRARNGLST